MLVGVDLLTVGTLPVRFPRAFYAYFFGNSVG